MASFALGSLMATIKLEFLQPNPRVPLDDDTRGSMNPSFKSLRMMEFFLESKPAGGLEMKIRDFALEAEDRIEIQLSNFLLAKDTQDQEQASQQLRQTLREVSKDGSKLLNQCYEEADDDEAPLIPWLSETSLRLQPPKLERTMVGRRHDYLLVKNQLLFGGDEQRVILIVGMTGIGKTTLAASVYEDSSVASHFGVRGWITVSPESNVRQTLHDLLLIVAEPDDETKKRSTRDETLAKQVSKCLEGKRYLIVLDNIWNNKAWGAIRECFPNDSNGSRIVLITTHFDQGSYSCSYDHHVHNMTLPYDHHVHNMNLLNPKESWDLFCSNPFLEQHMEPKLEKLRSGILEKCEGLPLSIVTVAQRLSKCNNIKREWKKVEKELELLGVLEDNTAFTLRYNQLAQHLKICFLYFGVFPKRSVIQVKQLIRLWIAEGFLSPLRHGRLENQAYKQLLQLIDRNLVLIDKRSFDGRIKTCKMHSVLHSFCVREAQKESFFCALNTQQLPRGSFSMFANSCRWLSFYTHKFDYYVLFRTNNPRSIFFFQEDVEISVPFKLLRVVAFAPSSFFQRVPTHLKDLVFLRYLYVTEWFEGLDYVVSTNRNLQTLVVSSKESQPGTPTLHLPCTIWESPRLQHLELGNSYVIDNPPSVVKNNMQTLSWVNPSHCREEVYYRLPNIKKLKIFFKDDLEPSHLQTGRPCNNPITLDNLDYLVWLETLTILVSAGCIVTRLERPIFPLQLKKLRLNGTNFCKRDLALIGMMPQLEVLKLENAFHQKIWEVDEGGFRQLKFLLLEAKQLEQWIVNEESFLYLERLVLKFCYCLKNIPMEIPNIGTVKSIELQQCGRSVVASAKDIQESKYLCRNGNLKIKIEGCEYDES
ncbi:putative late blight resistance protein homolog R1B-14 [Ipomoea triloba]|uniref:putative late blight resistance protein homolog R1B-14 n=1 Tax=Ipomoea triloba TaxID=35885 RepID=UPI00125E8DBA|nr:putative late blight resistance protein homolog R1B-14 [Ipomoea triloba]